MNKKKQKKMQQSKEKQTKFVEMVCARHPPMHLTPRESNRSVVSLQVCVELTRPGGHFISLQSMARSIHAFICYNNNNNNNNISFRLRRKRGKLIKT